MSVSFLGQPFVILNSSKHAFDMLEKKSAIYSSRPVIPFGGELVGWNRTLALLPYGNKFREYRRMIFQLIGSRKHVAGYAPLLDSSTRDLVVDLARDPSKLVKHIQKYVMLTSSSPHATHARGAGPRTLFGTGSPCTISATFCAVPGCAPQTPGGSMPLVRLPRRLRFLRSAPKSEFTLT